jgi:uncharacterized membrane protein YhiD involved in acid resistance
MALDQQGDPRSPREPAIAIDQRMMPHSVDSLTTAPSIWVTAALGVLCGLAARKLLVEAVAGVLFLLLAGGSIENWCQKALGIEEKVDPSDSR